MPAEPTATVPHFHLKVDGADIGQEKMDKLLDCTIESSQHLPDVCTVRMHDANFELLDANTFKEGKAIEVTGAEGRAQLQTLFKGEVTGVELDLAAHGVPTLVVRCYDKGHRLHRGRKARSFQQMTDSDIVKKVAQEAGLRVDADSTSQVHDWVMQNNQTNWEFVQERAAKAGCRLYIDDGDKLCFKKITDSASEGEAELEWGKDLRSFRPRTSASPQVDKVTVRGWDPKTKKEIIGTAQQPAGTPQVGLGRSGGDIAKQAFGSAEMVIVDRPVHSQAEATAIAQSACDEIGNAYLEADGLCYGRPDIKAGMQAKIQNIGQKFGGKYYITAATHTYTPAEGYATQVVVSGKRPQTLLSIVDGSDLERRAEIGGNIVVAIVTNNNDPDNGGRIKIKYPWLTTEHESFWARIATPMSGPDRGFNFLPEIDDEVLIAFEHGDIRRPYVIGCLWNGKDKLPKTRTDNYATDKAVSGGKVTRRWIRTREGHILEFFDKCGDKNGITLRTCNGFRVQLRDNDKKIEVITKDKAMVVLDDDKQLIRIVDKTDKNHMKITSSDNAILIEADGDITLNSKQNIYLKAQQNIELTAQSKVKITGQSGIEIKTPMQAQIEGQSGVSVKTSAALSLEGSASAELRSTGMLTIQGSLVKIN